MGQKMSHMGQCSTCQSKRLPRTTAVCDWDLLHEAVEQEIKDQRCLVEYWRRTVRTSQTAGRHKVACADRGVLPEADAEKLTGKWAKHAAIGLFTIALPQGVRLGAVWASLWR
jgi:hypothetical protein